jgi:hypothetical protein
MQPVSEWVPAEPYRLLTFLTVTSTWKRAELDPEVSWVRAGGGEGRSGRLAASA